MPHPITNLSRRGVSATSPDPEASSAIGLVLAGLATGLAVILLTTFVIYECVKSLKRKWKGKGSEKGMCV